MSRILMINLPFSGHTNPTLPLAKELVSRGHQVTYINAEAFREKIETTGACFVRYENYPAKPTEEQKKRLCFRATYDTALAQTEKFDLLIYEMFFYPGYVVAKKLGIPCVRQFSQPAWSWESFHRSPLFFKISARLIDVQVITRKNKHHMGLADKSMTQAIISDQPDLNVVYVHEMFQQCRETFDERFCFCVPPVEIHASSAVIPYEKMRHPIIYISLGSIISNRGFCKECIRAFGGTEFSVILNTGRVSPDSLGHIPPNIYAYSFVPQIEVLNHADLFLTHCGMNSVNEAMAAQVPMIAMPFVNDQVTNGRRVVELGIGKSIRSFPSSARQMYRTAQAVVKDESIRQNYANLSKQIKENAFSEIVDKIEDLLK